MIATSVTECKSINFKYTEKSAYSAEITSTGIVFNNNTNHHITCKRLNNSLPQSTLYLLIERKSCSLTAVNKMAAISHCHKGQQAF